MSTHYGVLRKNAWVRICILHNNHRKFGIHRKLVHLKCSKLAIRIYFQSIPNEELSDYYNEKLYQLGISKAILFMNTHCVTLSIKLLGWEFRILCTI